MRLLTTKAFTDLFNDPFEITLLKSAYARYSDLNDPLRCNLFSLVARELIRIFLTRIAPDADVESCEWFDPAINKGKATRADRFRYALTGRIANEVIDKHKSLDLNSQIKDLVDVIGALSKYAHISPGTVNMDLAAAGKYIQEVEDVLIEFCNKYYSVRDYIRDQVYEITQEEINDKLQNEIPDELDSLSSHTIFENAVVESVQDIDISSTTMSITGSGYVEVELNYGSMNDGVSSDDNYPFEFEAEIDPETLRISDVKVTIDNSSFYE